MVQVFDGFMEEIEKRRRNMLNIRKSFIVTGTVLCVSLGMLCGCQSVGKMVGSAIEHAAPKETESESRELDPFNRIDVSLAVGSVNLIQGDSYGIDISRTENCKIISKVKDDTLKIRYEMQDNKSGSATLTIKAPKDASLKTAGIDLDVGDVSVRDLSIKELTVKQATGDCEITDCKADKINVKGDVSGVDISGAPKDAAYFLAADVGTIDVRGKKKESPYQKDGGKKSINVEVSVGDITVE